MTQTNSRLLNVLLYFATATALSLAALSFGRDLNFDFINYHLYAGLAADGSRLRQDFFPAGIQSYLTPYSYLPLYWMVKSELSSDTVVVLLALIQSFVILPIWMICCRLGLSTTLPQRLWMAAVGLATPVLFIELGNTFNDLGSSVFVLLGLALAIPKSAERETLKSTALQAFCSGVVSGIGVALKLPLAAIAIAIPLALLLSRMSTLQRTRDRFWVVACWCLGATLTFTLLYGYWGYRLWQEFGNPFFPFFNGVFKSPLFPSFNITHERFKAQGLAEFLLRPLQISLFTRNTYTETMAPDGRPVLYAAGLIVACALTIAQWVTNKPLSSAGRRNSTALGLHVYLCFSWIFWMLSSGNGRYGLPLLITIGIVVAWWATQFKRPFDIAACLSIMAVQSACFFDGLATTRWTPYAASDRFLKLDIPPEISGRPAAYISVDPQSASFLANFVHSDSSFINLVGATPLAPEGPAMDRVRTILGTHDRMYAVLPISLILLRTGEPLVAPNIKRLSTMLEPYGLAPASNMCSVSKILDAYPSLLTFTLKSGQVEQMAGNHGFWFCPLRNITDSKTLVPTTFFSRAELALDALERRCKLFGPPKTAVSVRIDTGILRRSYVNTDATVAAIQINGTQIRLRSSAYGADNETDIGFINDSALKPDAWKCPSDRSRSVGRGFE